MSVHPYPPKLTLEQAEAMRAQYATGESVRRLATEFGVSVASAHDVVSGRSHIPRLVLRLTSQQLAELNALAARAGRSREDTALALLRRGLCQYAHAR